MAACSAISAASSRCWSARMRARVSRLARTMERASSSRVLARSCVAEFECFVCCRPLAYDLGVVGAQRSALREQTAMVLGDRREAVGELGGLHRLLAEDREEARDGLDAELAGCRQQGVEAGEQGRAVAGIGEAARRTISTTWSLGMPQTTWMALSVMSPWLDHRAVGAHLGAAEDAARWRATQWRRWPARAMWRRGPSGSWLGAAALDG